MPPTYEQTILEALDLWRQARRYSFVHIASLRTCFQLLRVEEGLPLSRGWIKRLSNALHRMTEDGKLEVREGSYSYRLSPRVVQLLRNEKGRQQRPAKRQRVTRGGVTLRQSKTAPTSTDLFTPAPSRQRASLDGRPDGYPTPATPVTPATAAPAVDDDPMSPPDTLHRTPRDRLVYQRVAQLATPKRRPNTPAATPATPGAPGTPTAAVNAAEAASPVDRFIRSRPLARRHTRSSWAPIERSGPQLQAQQLQIERAEEERRIALQDKERTERFARRNIEQLQSDVEAEKAAHAQRQADLEAEVNRLRDRLTNVNTRLQRAEAEAEAATAAIAQSSPRETREDLERLLDEAMDRVQDHRCGATPSSPFEGGDHGDTMFLDDHFDFRQDEGDDREHLHVPASSSGRTTLTPPSESNLDHSAPGTSGFLRRRRRRRSSDSAISLHMEDEDADEATLDLMGTFDDTFIHKDRGEGAHSRRHARLSLTSNALTLTPPATHPMSDPGCELPMSPLPLLDRGTSPTTHEPPNAATSLADLLSPTSSAHHLTPDTSVLPTGATDDRVAREAAEAFVRRIHAEAERARASLTIHENSDGLALDSAEGQRNNSGTPAQVALRDLETHHLRQLGLLESVVHELFPPVALGDSQHLFREGRVTFLHRAADLFDHLARARRSALASCQEAFASAPPAHPVPEPKVRYLVPSHEAEGTVLPVAPPRSAVQKMWQLLTGSTEAGSAAAETPAPFSPSTSVGTATTLLGPGGEDWDLAIQALETMVRLRSLAERRVEDLLTQLETAQTREDDLNERTAELQEALAKAATAHAQALEAQTNSAHAVLSDAQEAAQLRHEGDLRDLAALEDRLTQARRAHLDALEQRDTLQRELIGQCNEYESEIAGLRTELTKAHDRIREVEAQLATRTEELTTSTRENSELRRKLSEAQIHVEGLERDLDEQRALVAARAADLAAERTRHAEERRTWTEQTRYHTERMTELESELKSLHLALARATDGQRDTQVQSEVTSADLTRQIIHLRSEIVRINEERATLTEGHQDQILSLHRELAAGRTQSLNQAHELDSLRATVEDLTRQLETAGRTAGQRQKAFVTEMRRVDAEMERLQASRRALLDSLEADDDSGGENIVAGAAEPTATTDAPSPPPAKTTDKAEWEATALARAEREIATLTEQRRDLQRAHRTAAEMWASERDDLLDELSLLRCQARTLECADLARRHQPHLLDDNGHINLDEHVTATVAELEDELASLDASMRRHCDHLSRARQELMATQQERQTIDLAWQRQVRDFTSQREDMESELALHQDEQTAPDEDDDEGRRQGDLVPLDEQVHDALTRLEANHAEAHTAHQVNAENRDAQLTELRGTIATFETSYQALTARAHEITTHLRHALAPPPSSLTPRPVSSTAAARQDSASNDDPLLYQDYVRLQAHCQALEEQVKRCTRIAHALSEDYVQLESEAARADQYHPATP